MTPIGRWRIRQVYWRNDRDFRWAAPATTPMVPSHRLRPSDGWCDDVDDANYNRHVCHPYPASAERLWRDDRLYDVILVLDYNVHPCQRRRGSAIFLHVARQDQAGRLAPTEGCVALAPLDLRRLLLLLRPGAHVHVVG